MQNSMNVLFTKHLAALQTTIERSLAENSTPGLVIAAGAPIMKFEDDMPYTFIVNHHFRHWCPLKGSHHALVIRAGKKPLLLAHEPADYWHAVEKVGENSFWSDAFEIKTFAESERLWKYTAENFAGFAMHGQESFQPQAIGLVPIPPRLLANLDWERAKKTDFEVSCLLEATRLGARGHVAARKAFLSGDTEFGIHIEFMRAMELGEDELPYPTIIGLNSNASILHYHNKNKSVRDGHVLLIDAGGQFNDYASDITRTHTSTQANPEFMALITSMEKAQGRLCDLVKPGLSNRELNHASRMEVAKILVEHKILTDISAEAIVAENLVFDFYPHGIGHPLGIHVHDVGGYQQDRNGGVLERTELDGSLRSLRTFEPRTYQTVEPGLYFIGMLLERRKQTPFTKFYNWKLIKNLMPSGGIRIEDNVLVTETGHRNLTREVLKF